MPPGLLTKTQDSGLCLAAGRRPLRVFDPRLNESITTPSAHLELIRQDAAPIRIGVHDLAMLPLFVAQRDDAHRKRRRILAVRSAMIAIVTHPDLVASLRRLTDGPIDVLDRVGDSGLVN